MTADELPPEIWFCYNLRTLLKLSLQFGIKHSELQIFYALFSERYRYHIVLICQ